MHSPNLAPPPQEQYPAQQPECTAPEIQVDAYIGLRYGKTIDVSRYEPLLTAEQSSEEMGFPTGALQAVIRLPHKQSFFLGLTPPELAGNEGFAAFLQENYDEYTRRRNNATVYCFKAPEAVGRHGVSQPGYYFMGLEQIKQLRDQAQYGPSSLPDTRGGVLDLEAGQKVRIGRGNDSWLPNVGWDYAQLKNHDQHLGEILGQHLSTR